ncbi:hypothetical protein COS86_01645 [Candidatus Bathyarchaeota archaeon CG07_land_8_20_14_0_80_47_9]|nr:MAG: hypothetical protein COS86_01645 [Candidatus Bathyarchaeota archaeon CG07_land_8_20_14_0_80_47_9]
MAHEYLLLGTRLSDTTRLSSKDVKNWLERETGSIFNPVHAKAKKLLGEMSKALNDLSGTSKMLFDNSEKEIEKRNMKTYKRARALNKLARLFLDRTKQVRVPDNVTYDSFGKFVQETQKALIVIEVDVRNWFPRISPFFIIDRRKFLVVFEKAKGSLEELHGFLTKEYVKTKTLEETFQLADKLKALEEQLANADEQKKRTENERVSLEKEIAEAHQKMADLRSKGNMSQLSQASGKIDELGAEVKQSLRHLQKPFIKLQSLSLRGGGSGLTQDELAKLNQYLENPFEAFAMEETGYPVLKEILQKLDRSMSEKLKLKPEKERKARQAIDNILRKNSLANLHQRCVEVMRLEKQLSASAEVAETKQGLSKLQERLEDLNRRKRIVESEEIAIRRAHDETLEKIRNCKDEIEKNILSFMNRRIHID